MEGGPDPPLVASFIILKALNPAPPIPHLILHPRRIVIALRELVAAQLCRSTELAGNLAPVMALIVPPANEKKRVKVYELKNNDWFDRGTGFCTGRIINVSDHETGDTLNRGLIRLDLLCNHEEDTRLIWVVG